MVCANASAVFVRELDLFRVKVGLERSEATYQVAGANELHWSLEQFDFLKPDHDLPPLSQ